MHYKIKHTDSLATLAAQGVDIQQFLNLNPGLSKLKTGSTVVLPKRAPGAPVGSMPPVDVRPNPPPRGSPGYRDPTGMPVFQTGQSWDQTRWRNGTGGDTPPSSNPRWDQNAGGILLDNGMIRMPDGSIRSGGKPIQGDPNRVRTGYTPPPPGFIRPPRSTPGSSSDTTKWIDFTKPQPGMSWAEYNARLRAAQAAGYKGPSLRPSNGISGAGILGFWKYPNKSGSIYQNSYFGVSHPDGPDPNGPQPRRPQSQNPQQNPQQTPQQTPPQDSNWLDGLIQQNPQLAQFRDLILGAMGGNSARNNNANTGMNWRF